MNNCGSRPLNISSTSVKTQVDEFIRIVQDMLKHYMSNNVIVTMGEDFHYQDAGKWYRNLDKLIK